MHTKNIGSSETRLIRPCLQQGQTVTSTLVNRSIFSCIVSTGISGRSGHRPSSSQHLIRSCFLQRLARKPKWRIRLYESGITWNRKRRINSWARIVICLHLSPSVRSLYQNVTKPSSIFTMRWLAMATWWVYRPSSPLPSQGR